ncbi:hypothetical protein HHI36_014365, partial [Cryptolaemus montrouzieri]
MARVDCMRNFFKNYNLSLRTSQKTSLEMIMGFNKIQVEKFYDNQTKIMSDQKFPPSRIYNMNETGITTVPNIIPKVVAVKWKQSV